jgi:Sec-independent protein translocase protein TatA
MTFMNLGIGEILFIIIIAVIIFGPGNMVKTARDAGVFLRKVAKSPYWQEIWATKRELSEIPKMIVKEAQLNETLSELNKETKTLKSSMASSVSDFLKEVNQPVELIDTPPAKEKTESQTIEDKPIATEIESKVTKQDNAEE